MINEFQRVILLADLPEYNLLTGDIGTVVMVHNSNLGFEVEFMTLDGETITVATLPIEQIRSVGHKEIAHVRSILAL